MQLAIPLQKISGTDSLPVMKRLAGQALPAGAICGEIVPVRLTATFTFGLHQVGLGQSAA